jgi:hypothetical protein
VEIWTITEHTERMLRCTGQANWTHSQALNPGGEQRDWEDPNLWFDRRGNFHIMYHVYTTNHNYTVQRHVDEPS